MMKHCIIFVLVCVTVAYGMDIKYKECGEEEKGLAEIKRMAIEPCTEQPCNIVEGKNATIYVEFQPSEDIDKLTTKIKAHVGPIWVDYHIEHTNACEGTGLECPIKAGTDNTFKFELMVSTSYPKLDLVLKWLLIDGDKKNQVCAEFAIKVV